VPNVVGYDAVLDAIRKVWASPFTERSYSWRQAHMKDPEYVFASVVVQRAFASEKSGVMVSADVDSGEPGYLTIAVNEGVAGVVDGQPAEVVRVELESGQATLLAQATASQRKVLPPEGGVALRPTSGAERILESREIEQLVKLAKDVPARFPSLRTLTGEAVPADVEFAFRDGRLAILQIRPFNESRRAQKSQYLAQLDAPFVARGDVTVPLGVLPNAPPVAAAEAGKTATAEERR
jgi:phosphoenolpyruvate synthase/pyruvate phosphate dikinase